MYTFLNTYTRVFFNNYTHGIKKIHIFSSIYIHVFIDTFSYTNIGALKHYTGNYEMMR
jgi:hypothetical protein